MHYYCLQRNDVIKSETASKPNQSVMAMRVNAVHINERKEREGKIALKLMVDLNNANNNKHRGKNRNKKKKRRDENLLYLSKFINFSGYCLVYVCNFIVYAEAKSVLSYACLSYGYWYVGLCYFDETIFAFARAHTSTKPMKYKSSKRPIK